MDCPPERPLPLHSAITAHGTQRGPESQGAGAAGGLALSRVGSGALCRQGPLLLPRGSDRPSRPLHSLEGGRRLALRVLGPTWL